MSSIAQRARLSAPASDPRAVRRARARLWDRAMTGVLWGLAAGLAALLAAMLIYLVARGIGVINWQFLTSEANGGDGAALFNTFYIIALALLICIPLAVGAAIYLVEYAKQGPFVTAVRFATETLAGIPSIILGLFGFLVFVTEFGTGTRFGVSRLAGALTLVILNLPLLLRVSEDALRSVPNDLREASAAVGASRFQTVWRVMLPTALPAVTTGIILTAGKMIGETAALIFTSGGNSPAVGWFSLNPFTVGDTLTVHLYELQAEGVIRNAVQIANGTATLLILLLLVFNLGIRGLASLLNRRLAGRRS
ncbi:MAG TPA: phosphate ABC transporter permease PstA [Ktedonobacterales bacterium]|nr:phosphate ABC transporter permease PstA [Ktedonobacterales bacterium]